MRDEPGLTMFELVNTVTPAEPKNVYRQAALDLIFGQVWTRPGLTRRQRRWVSLAAAGMRGAAIGITAHVYGALNSQEISPEEIGEFLLHFACYAGWPRATEIDSVVEQVLQRIASERGEAPPERVFAKLRHESLENLAGPARETRLAVLGTPDVPVPEGTPAADLLATALEYGQVWSRPQLARADRRLIALTCLAIQGTDGLLRAHLDAALESGELDVTALRELALHVGLYAGMPVALVIDAAVTGVTARSF
jgi:4-carboxymuconolactone decarboxylase